MFAHYSDDNPRFAQCSTSDSPISPSAPSPKLMILATGRHDGAQAPENNLPCALALGRGAAPARDLWHIGSTVLFLGPRLP